MINIRPVSLKFTLMLLLVFIFNLVGCENNNSKKFKEKKSKLSILSIDGVSENSKISPLWGMAYEKTFKLKSCLGDGQYFKPIIGQKINITDKDRKTIGQGTTDSSGCVRWHETLQFDPFAQPSFIEKIRGFELDSHPIEASFGRVGLNPWMGINGSEPDVVDLDEVSVSRTILELDNVKKEKSVDKQKRQGALLVKQVDLKLILSKQSQDRTSADLSINFSPLLKLYNMVDQEIILNPAKGQIKVDVEILAKQPGDSKSLLVLHEPVEVREALYVNGRVALHDLPIKFSRELSETYSYFVRLRLRPTDAPGELKEFNQIFSLGNRNNLAQANAFPSGIEPEHAANENPPLLTSPVGDVSLGDVQARPNGLRGENTTSRNVRVQFVVKVISNLDKKPVSNRKFNIYYLGNASGPKHESVPSDVYGELKWEDTIVHDYYSSEKSQTTKITFEDVKSGVKFTKIVEIDFKNLNNGNFARESVPGFQEQLKSIDEFEKGAVIYIDQQCIYRADTRYEISEDLGLNIFHKYNIQLSPSVLDFTNLQRGLPLGKELLRSGHYKLNLVVFQDKGATLENGQIIASIENLIEHKGEKLSAQVEIPFFDFGVIDQKSHIAVQLSLVGSDSKETTSLKSLVYTFPFVLSRDSCSQNLETSELLMDKFNKLTLNSGVSLAQLNLDYQNELNEKLKSKNPKLMPNYWTSWAQDNGLRPRFLTDGPSIRPSHLKYISEKNHKDYFQCVYESGWQFDEFKANCRQDEEIQKTARDVCYNESLQFREFLHDNKVYDNWKLRRWKRLFYTGCLKKPFDFFKSSKRIHAYKTDPSKNKALGGFSTRYSIHNTHDIAFFWGSDFMNETNDAIEFEVKAHAHKAFNAKVASSVVDNFHELAGIQANILSGGPSAKNMVRRLDSSVKAIARRDSFKWLFDYELVLNFGVLTNSGFLRIENVNMEMELSEYRVCYTLNHQFDDLVLKEMPSLEKWDANWGSYNCFEIERSPIQVTEKYYFIFNEANEGVSIDGLDSKNRWMMMVRGDRDFGLFLMSTKDHMNAYQRNDVITETESIMKRAWENLAPTLGAEDGTWLAGYPGNMNYKIFSEKSFVERIVDWFSDNVYNPLNKRGSERLSDQNDPDLRK